MQIYKLDPMQDSRWDDLVSTHPRASVFHQSGWLEALARTYGYRPIALTSTPPGNKLSDGIVFCEIKSWATGSRLVSLPFADHCESLLNEGGNPIVLTDWMQSERRQRRWKYIECRPLSEDMLPECPPVTTQSFWLHNLDLAPPIEQIFRSLHKNCMQRRIRRAERERLSYERGCSEELLNDFYRLVMITRRRHQLLPQPRAWFRNLLACAWPNVEIRLARKGSIPVAAIMTLRHRGTVVYKYGCSDQEFHHLVGMAFLFWKLIEEAKTAGADRFWPYRPGEHWFDQV